MRSAEQIGRTVGEWHDFQRAEREKHLKALLAMLSEARERNAPWYQWVIDRRDGTHRHGLREPGKSGKLRDVACPVRGCRG